MSDSPDQANSSYKTQHTSAASALGEALDVVGHEDPDKHVIGGSLPVATDEELQPVGTGSTAGFSAFPARADHVHAIRSPFAVAGLSAPVVIPNTGVRTYINTFANVLAGGRENWIGAGPQTIDFARAGLYILGFHCIVIPDVGVNMGPGYLVSGITFGGTFVYAFSKTFIENGQDVFYYDITHFHEDAGNGWAEVWFENNCPVNLRVTSIQFVGSYVSTTA